MQSRTKTYYRRPLTLEARVAPTAGTVRTPQGPKPIQAGDYIVRGPDGAYTLDRQTFEDIYEPVPARPGWYVSKPATVQASMALLSLVLRTKRGEEWARPSDYIVTHQDGSTSILDRSTFQFRYTEEPSA